MNVEVNNGQIVTIPGIDGQSAVSTQEGKVRVAAWPTQIRPEFKSGYEFEYSGETWVVLEIAKSPNSPSVASIKPVGKE